MIVDMSNYYFSMIDRDLHSILNVDNPSYQNDKVQEILQYNAMCQSKGFLKSIETQIQSLFSDVDPSEVDEFAKILNSSIELKTSDKTLLNTIPSMEPLYLYSIFVRCRYARIPFNVFSDIIETTEHFIKQIKTFFQTITESFIFSDNLQKGRWLSGGEFLNQEQIDKIVQGKISILDMNKNEVSDQDMEDWVIDLCKMFEVRHPDSRSYIFKKVFSQPDYLLSFYKSMEEISMLIQTIEDYYSKNEVKGTLDYRIFLIYQAGFYDNCIKIVGNLEKHFELMQLSKEIAFSKVGKKKVDGFASLEDYRCRLDDSILFDDLHNDSCEDFIQSLEEKDDKSSEDTDNVERKKAFVTFMNKTTNKINQLANRVRFFLKKGGLRKRLFYRKHMGKIEGLFKFYAQRVQVPENKLKGDPVKIIQNDCKEYLEGVIKQFININQSYFKLSDSLVDTNSLDEAIKKINLFITYDEKLNQDNYNKVKAILKTDMVFKFATILMKNNTIYGHTIESVTKKRKLPPPNHAIVSLFTENPQQKPELTSISDIFESADSFKTMYYKEKDVYNSILTINLSLMQKVNGKTMKRVNQKEDDDIKNLMISNFRKTGNSDEDLKKLKNAVRGVYSAWQAYIVKQNYIYRMNTVYYKMIRRIDKMCQTSVKLLSNAEKNDSQKDKRYNTGTKTKGYKIRDTD